MVCAHKTKSADIVFPTGADNALVYRLDIPTKPKSPLQGDPRISDNRYRNLRAARPCVTRLLFLCFFPSQENIRGGFGTILGTLKASHIIVKLERSTHWAYLLLKAS